MKKHYLIFILIGLIFLVNFSIKDQTRSILFGTTASSAKFFSNTGISLTKKFSFFFTIRNLRRQNQELIDKITQYQVDESRMTELEKENVLLQKELGFLDQNEKGTLVPARIVDREPTSFLDFFIVDKGSDDNIAQDAAVVYNGVLVGQVKEVYKSTSKIVLVTSKDSLIQTMLQECRAKGILKGGINGLFMENIISDTEYKPGEYIVTSGLGGKLRPGILIGRAGKIQSSSSGIFKNIAVEPIVDFSVLELVFIEKK